MHDINGCVQVLTVLRLQRFAYGMHSPEPGAHAHLLIFLRFLVLDAIDPNCRLHLGFIWFLQVCSVSFMTEDMPVQPYIVFKVSRMLITPQLWAFLSTTIWYWRWPILLAAFVLFCETLWDHVFINHGQLPRPLVLAGPDRIGRCSAKTLLGYT